MAQTVPTQIGFCHTNRLRRIRLSANNFTTFSFFSIFHNSQRDNLRINSFSHFLALSQFSLVCVVCRCIMPERDFLLGWPNESGQMMIFALEIYLFSTCCARAFALSCQLDWTEWVNEVKLIPYHCLLSHFVVTAVDRPWWLRRRVVKDNDSRRCFKTHTHSHTDRCGTKRNQIELL